MSSSHTKGAIIRAWRQELGLSAIDLAKVTRLDVGTISRIENNRTGIGIKTAIAFRAVFGERIITLLEDRVVEALGWDTRTTTP